MCGFDYDSPEDEKEFLCNVCGVEIESEGICKKRQCFIIDNN